MAGHPVNYASICIARPNTGEVGILFELRGAKGLARGLSLDLVFDRISAAQFRSYTKRALMPFIRTGARLPLERQDSI